MKKLIKKQKKIWFNLSNQINPLNPENVSWKCDN